ncbi:MAG: PD-(D/E)XK nuclease family protein [Acidobacteria bacterium]|nr:PD-(D/E)XK nuclease family protein [Acidobacteriota bacterium]
MGDEFARSFCRTSWRIRPGHRPRSRRSILMFGIFPGLRWFREWRNIDILLKDKSNKLAVVIENKIDSGEHSEQLTRYRQIAKEGVCRLAHPLHLSDQAGDSANRQQIHRIRLRDGAARADRLIAETRIDALRRVLTLF